MTPIAKISLASRLPDGAINELAEKLGLTRQAVWAILRGRYGKEETMRALVNFSIEILERNIQENQDTVLELRRMAEAS